MARELPVDSTRSARSRKAAGTAAIALVVGLAAITAQAGETDPCVLNIQPAIVPHAGGTPGSTPGRMG